LPKIHVHRSGEAGIFANAYIVEGQSGLVVIDGTLTVSESGRLRKTAESLGKPILGILITHAHPDHVAGISRLADSETVPIYALGSVANLMLETESAKHAQWAPAFKDEWIPKWTHPNRFVKDGQRIEFGEIRFRVFDMGAGGDCDANSVWILENEPRAAFVGDLVFNGTHCYLADGRIEDWHRNLRRLRELVTDVPAIYPGHGAPGSVEMILQQKAYLETYCRAVSAVGKGSPTLSDRQKERLVGVMQEFLPNAGLSFMIALSADRVAGELAIPDRNGDAA
jgi:glyoxylase-like metal-dependent hydrolase (beta-lactamase superfamily II)